MKTTLRTGIIFILALVSIFVFNASSASAYADTLPALQGTAGGPKATVKEGTVNVRSGPGTAYAIVGRTKAGQSHEITGKNKDGSWWEIDFGGKKSWIYGPLMTVEGNTTAVPVVAAPPLPKVQPKPAAGAAAGYFGYGIQIDPAADRGAAINDTRQLGFTWVKFQLPWKDYEGTQGVKNFPDDIVNDLNGNGLNILVSIVKAPNWARNPAYGFPEEGPPADPATYASYVGEFAKRYCGRVQAVEVWNEQNLHYEWGNEPLDAGRYVQLLAAAYRSIKANCPQMVVVSGALTPAGNVNIGGEQKAIDDQQYLKAMYRAGLARYSDAIGVHPSGYNVAPDVGWQQACGFITGQASSFRGACDTPHPSWSFRSTMEGYRNIMVANGDRKKRLWPTEFGWATNWIGDPRYAYAQDNTPEEQAAWTVRAFQMMRDWGWVGPAFLWNLNYSSGEQGQWQANGRPVFGALAGMAK